MSTAGTQGNGETWSKASLSADGRYVAFDSAADNLVSGDTNGVRDVFVHDRQTGLTERVSVGPAGAQANGESYSTSTSISADGRYVAFTSGASNLVPNDTNAQGDIFVHDRSTGLTERVSVGSGGVQSDGSSYAPSLSPDGRFVAFQSWGTNFVAGDTNGTTDVYLHDRQSGQTTRESVSSTGVGANGLAGGPAVSADGRCVAFYSLASNLVSGDSNAAYDVFVRDRQSGLTTRVSVDSAGVQGNRTSTWPAISADGRFVTFTSWSTNLGAGALNAFVHDRQTAQTWCVSVSSAGIAGGGVNGPTAISADGRRAAFYSSEASLVVGDTNGATDVFVHDLQTAQTSRVSVDSSGFQGNAESATPALSADGRYVAFHSSATNLVADDTNGVRDAFVHDTVGCTPTATTYCTAKVNSLGCTPQIAPEGTPSLYGGPGSFTITAHMLLNQKSGMLYYGFAPVAVPFQGGVRCVAAPSVRTPVVRTGGSLDIDDCSGSIAFDMGAHIDSRADPNLVCGAHVYAQVWSRDPADPHTTNLTAGVEFTIGP